MMKLKKDLKQQQSVPRLITSTPTSPIHSYGKQLAIEEGPEKCVTLNILAEPPQGTPIRADVIFIHGLHGKYT